MSVRTPKAMDVGVTVTTSKLAWAETGGDVGLGSGVRIHEPATSATKQKAQQARTKEGKGGSTNRRKHLIEDWREGAVAFMKLIHH